MMKAIENILDFVLRCIMPLPYCEVDGHKFWRKSSYESWLEIQELSRMRNEGKLHHVNYRNGYEHDARSIRDMLLEHLENSNGKIYKVICMHFEPCNSSYDVMYLCDKKLELRYPRIIDEAHVVDNW